MRAIYRSAGWVLAGVLLMGAGASTQPAGASGGTPPSVVGPVPAAGDSGSNAGRDQNRGDRNGRQGRNGRGPGGNGNGGNGGGAGGPTTSPSDPYGILEVRSIFVKGNQNIAANPAPPRPPERNRQFDIRPNLLVFNGVTIIDNQPEAFVEDLGTNVVGKVKIGDAVAGGTVASITFDDLAYQANGQLKHVGLGQDFNGNAAFAAATVTPTTEPTAAAPNVPGQVVGAGASIPMPVVTQSGLSAQDILARMKAKRDQEAHQLGTK